MSIRYINSIGKNSILGIKNTGSLPEGPITHYDSSELISPLTILGSGYEHHLSLKINYDLFERNINHDLILIDQHSDYTRNFRAKLGCANWINYYLDLFTNSKVCFIGLNPYGIYCLKHDLLEEHNKRVILLDACPSDEDLENAFSQLTNSVYVSYDLDVLKFQKYFGWWAPELSNPKNWNHGEMELENLINISQLIDNSKDIVGLDISGPRPESPPSYFGWPGNIIIMSKIINCYLKQVNDEELDELFSQNNEWFRILPNWWNILELIKRKRTINRTNDLSTINFDN